MFTAKAQRPYFEAWLRRTRRQLAPSGRLTEAALVLAREEGGTEASWRQFLRQLLEGLESPTIEMLTRIDALLASAKPGSNSLDTQDFLF